MKARLYFIFALIISAVVLFSCDKEEDTPPQSAAKFAANPTTAMVNEEIQFTNSSENATAFTWSFGDGTTSNAVSPKKSYNNVGVYLVSLVSTGAGGSTIQNLTVTIIPRASFTVENADNLLSNTPIQFTNTSEGATSYLWEFGDAQNSTSTEENPTFSYSTGGTYTVTLTATSAEGESSVSKEISLTEVSKEIFFIEYGNTIIKKLALDGSGTVSPFLDLTGLAGVGMAYDAANSKIYFSDFEVGMEGKIWRVNLDGSGLEELVGGIDDPYGIALDLSNGKIYWTDNAGNISRSNLDGSTVEIGIVNISGGGMRAIDLDVENNKMYFYEVIAEDLYVADLDGSNPTVLIAGVYGYGIKVDTVNDKIYFDEQNSETLIKANLDGSGQETFDDNGTRIYGMDIDNEAGVIYWTGRDSNEISKANLDGTGKEVLKDGLSSPRGMFLRK
ncbi:PKD domain-containing protein [Cryomorpha ignava]|uniref:PKD domain-containing protein n=1 Tax=Cryomorpha ignava TaxID=101383 RepID=A0A7K3WQN8_9FLAO|nr:PKD domain-containing protein [Cryomorpha ignava]NEN23202.1 PKD domain-containing protein [Cryomorpha ignava]